MQGQSDKINQFPILVYQQSFRQYLNNIMSSNSKTLQKQLRTLIPSMVEKDLKKVFEAFRQTIGDSIQYVCKEISYKCYEGTLSIKGKKASGYGRNDQEAYCHAIKNLLQMLIEEDDLLFVLRHCIKKVNQPEEVNKENQPRKSLTIKSNLSTSVNIGEINEGRKSKAYLKQNHVESLNISLHKIASTKTDVELELEGAKIYISQLELKLKTLEEENKYLKNKVQSQQIPQPPSVSASAFTSTSVQPIVNNFINNHSDYNKLPFESKHTQSHFSHHEKTLEKLNCSVEQAYKKEKIEKIELEKRQQEVKVKVPPIPKLKLEILPNFHGKSNKSINHSFLANQEAMEK